MKIAIIAVLVSVIFISEYLLFSESELNNIEKSYPRYTSYTNHSSRKEQPCTPVKRVVFIKSTKTGSSTISSIIGRYAYNQNLSMPLYNTKYGVEPFNRNLMKGQSDLHILASHTFYNRPEMDFVFRDALYVTIVREPVARFESYFDFVGIAKKHNIQNFDNPIEEFMRQPEKYTNNSNQQFYRLGLERLKFKDESTIQYKLKQLDFEFDLVMITEYIDESLILMKNLFCWKFEDILYLSKMVRTKPRPILKATLKEKIRSWDSADVILYNYFNKTLWQTISESGDTFFDDLETFRKMKAAATKRCVDKYVSRSNKERPDMYAIHIQHNLSKMDTVFCNNLRQYMEAFMKIMDARKS